jgi:hypothetical protein
MSTDSSIVTNTFALIDFAVHDGAYDDLRTRFPVVRTGSLFEGTPEEHLASASPVLLDYGPHSDNTALRDWCMMLERTAPSVTWIESQYSLPVLRYMLACRMECTINEGQPVVLRFWDPRIVLGLPSALDPVQRCHFFAPVDTWTAWESRRQQYYTITAPPEARSLQRFAAMPMALSESQRAQLMYYDKEALYDRIVQHWKETCPNAIDGIEAAMLREIAIAAVARCSTYGIDSADDQILFAGLMMAVSPSFDDHPAVQRALRDQDVAAGDRLSRMIDQMPGALWDQLARNKRYDALFEHHPPALA